MESTTRRQTPPNARKSAGWWCKMSSPGRLQRRPLYRQKDLSDRSTTAVVDRAIQTLKKDLAGIVARRRGGWGEHVDEAAEAHNARPPAAVTVAPEDVRRSMKLDPADFASEAGKKAIDAFEMLINFPPRTAPRPARFANLLSQCQR